MKQWTFDEGNKYSVGGLLQEDFSSGGMNKILVIVGL